MSKYQDFTMETITAVVGRDPEDNSEGIAAIGTDEGMLPLISSDKVREEHLRKAATALKSMHPDQQFYLVRFKRTGEDEPL